MGLLQRHVPALKSLVSSIYASLEDRDTLDINEEDLQPARAFYEERKVQTPDMSGANDWRGWSDDLDGVCDIDTHIMDCAPFLMCFF
jgi:hypothetical protein